MTAHHTDKRASLKRLKSDLADTSKPEIISKYPHLDNDKNREQLRASIKALAEDIVYDEAVESRLVLQTVPTTYEGYVSMRQGYGFTVQLTEPEWRKCFEEDNKRLGPPPTRKDPTHE